MSEGGMLYLILVSGAWLIFAAVLFLGMMRTSPPSVGTHARTEPPPAGAAHQKG